MKPTWIPEIFEEDDETPCTYKTHWIYKDIEGKDIGAVVRFHRPDGSKIPIPFFWPRRPEGFNKGMPDELKKVRPIFGLETLKADEVIYILEGEKCTTAVHSLGRCALCWQGGCNAAGKATEWKGLDAVKTVYLLPDNDKGGREAMLKIAAILFAAYPTLHIYSAEDPAWPAGGDFVDGLKRIDPLWDGILPFPDIEAGSKELDRVVASFAKIAIAKAAETSEEKPLIPVEAPKIKTFKFLNFEEFMAMDEKPRFPLFGEWLLTGMPVLLSGASGSGKSLFAHSIAVAMASGGEAFGWKAAKPVKVGILDGEMFDHTIKSRLIQIVEGADAGFDPENLKIFTRDLCTTSNQSFPNLRFPDDKVAILNAIKGREILIADNINNLFPGGDERGTQFWQAVEEFIWECRALNIAPVLVHHTTKTTPDSPAGSSRNIRVVEISCVISVIDPKELGANFNIQFHKTRELTSDTEPRSAKAVSDPETGLKWVMGPFVNPDDSDFLEPEWVEQARQFFRTGKSYGEVAKIVGKPKTTVQRWLKK